MTEELSGQALIDSLHTQMAAASAKEDWKTVGKVARELVDAERGIEKAAKEALQAALSDITLKVKTAVDKTIAKFIEAGDLDGADGVWYSKDFGDEASGCRLTKTAPKVKGETSTGNGSYVSRPEKSADLLKTEGSKQFFSGGKLVTSTTIDKAEYSFPDGLTLQEAWDYSTNGGWRNKVRMAILKSAGLMEQA